MPKVNRSDTFYVKLPEHLRTASIPDAKIQISLNVTTPKGFEEDVQEIICKIMKDGQKTFKKGMKSAIEWKE